MITNKNEAKAMTKHVSSCNSTTCNSSKKWNNETCLCERKIIAHAKKFIVRILANHCVKYRNFT